MLSYAFLRSPRFWIPFVVVGFLFTVFFAWQLNVFSAYGFSGPPRPPVPTHEVIGTIFVVFLLSLNAVLFSWKRKYGVCPVGVRRGMSVAAGFGVLALLCPVCAFGTFVLLGVAVSLSFVTPFIPLLQIVALMLLLTTLWLLVKE